MAIETRNYQAKYDQEIVDRIIPVQSALADFNSLPCETMTTLRDNSRCGLRNRRAIGRIDRYRPSVHPSVFRDTMHFGELCGQLCGPRQRIGARGVASSTRAHKTDPLQTQQYGYVAITAARQQSPPPKSSLYNATSLIGLTAATGTSMHRNYLSSPPLFASAVRAADARVLCSLIPFARGLYTYQRMHTLANVSRGFDRAIAPFRFLLSSHPVHRPRDKT